VALAATRRNERAVIFMMIIEEEVSVSVSVGKE
jgi:hypothetical protein